MTADSARAGCRDPERGRIRPHRRPYSLDLDDLEALAGPGPGRQPVRGTAARPARSCAGSRSWLEEVRGRRRHQGHGPNYLVGLSDWEPAPATATADIPAGPSTLPGLVAEGRESLERRRAATPRARIGVRHCEGRVPARRRAQQFRRPHADDPYAAAGSTITDLLRVAAAGRLSGALVTIPSYDDVPAAVRNAIDALGITVRVEDDATWHARAASLVGGLIRLLGGSAAELYAAIGGRPDIAIYAQPVEAGRSELLPCASRPCRASPRTASARRTTCPTS